MTQKFALCLAAAFGGALGSLLRYSITVLFPHNGDFPYNILLINTAGSFSLGFFTAFLTRYFPSSSVLKIFVCTGIHGGFTTFSTFSLDSVVLLSGNFYAGMLNILLNPLLSLIAVTLGWHSQKKMCH